MSPCPPSSSHCNHYRIAMVASTNISYLTRNGIYWSQCAKFLGERVPENFWTVNVVSEQFVPARRLLAQPARLTASFSRPRPACGPSGPCIRLLLYVSFCLSVLSFLVNKISQKVTNAFWQNFMEVRLSPGRNRSRVAIFLLSSTANKPLSVQDISSFAKLRADKKCPFFWDSVYIITGVKGYGPTSFRVSAPDIWNSLPSDIKRYISLQWVNEYGLTAHQHSLGF